MRIQITHAYGDFISDRRISRWYSGWNRNKVEDYGVGFYTKYGDGGVDIAPIADLYKSEVWELGEYLE